MFDGLTIVVFFELLHPDQPYRYATSYSAVEFNGNTYQPSGQLISVGRLEESEGFRVLRTSVKISLKGADQSADVVNQILLADLRDERIRGAELNIDAGFYDAQGALIASQALWRGVVDGVTMSPADASATFDVISGRGIIRRREQFNFSDAHQKEIYSDDDGFAFQVTNFQNIVEVNSGGSGAGAGSSGGSGFGGSGFGARTSLR